MNENLNVLFKKIISDIDFTQNMKKKKNLKDLYDYCSSSVEGYTLEEFKEFLKSIIIINKRISEKSKELSEEEISNIAGGVNFSLQSNKALAALMSGVFIAGYGSGMVTHASDISSGMQNQVGSNIVEKNIDFNNINNEINKIAQNVSEKTKQALQIASEAAENCIGVVLDATTPKANAQEIYQVQRVKPQITSWPTASKVKVGNTVSQSRLYGGSASVDGYFQWLPTIQNESLTRAGTVNYICQFVPNDQQRYVKVTQSIPIRVEQEEMRISWPTASSIVYGQRVCDSRLSGGRSNIPGNFEWDSSYLYEQPGAGTATYKVIFRPNENNYRAESRFINITVNKAPVRITSNPSATSIVYGQSLSNSVLSGFRANVDGQLRWSNPNITPNAGDYYADAVFTPYNQNYESTTIRVRVVVRKSTPVLSNTYYTSNYKSNMHIMDFALPRGWHWENPYFKFNRAGEFRLIAVFDGDSNYLKSKQEVIIRINRIDPVVPVVDDIKYNSSRTLSDIKLPAGWHWKHPNEVPRVSKSYYKAYFNSDEVNSDIYKNAYDVDIKIKVSHATPDVYSPPVAENIVYGQPLKDSKLSGLYSNVIGIVRWVDSGKKLNAGLHYESIIFVPFDINYKSIVLSVPVNVDKLMPRLSKTHYERDYSPNLRLKDFDLPYGWNWENPDSKLDNVGDFTFKAVYREDSNHYKNKENISITINKANPTLSMPDITYNENTKLKDIKLPAGWHFLDESEVPVASKNSYLARFDAKEANTNFYKSQDKVNVKMNVKKAHTIVEKWPELSMEYNDNMKDTVLSGKANTAGKFKLTEVPNKIGENLCSVEFTPNNPNYESLKGQAKIQLSKNMTVSPAPKLNIKSVKRLDKSIKVDVENKDINIESIEFSLDNGKTWNGSSKFKDLTPKTNYNFVYRFKDSELRCASKMSDAMKISTKDSAPAAPKSPKVKRRTNHEITLEGNELLEFSKDNGKTWQSSPVFSDLKGSTKCEFVSRVKENDDHVAGLVSKPTKTSTRNWLTHLIVNRLLGE